MEAFNQTIRLRMIGSCCDDLDPPDLGELLEDGRRELRASVGRYCGRNAEMLDPAKRQGIDHRLGRDIDQRNGDRPSCKPIHCGEEVFETI